MSCYNGCISQNTSLFPGCTDSCCDANVLAHFDGDMSKVTAEPVYVQKIYDAVLLRMQGLRTVQEQVFTPAIPTGFRITGISSIKSRKAFNPSNINDPANLKITADTCVSGASFVKSGTNDITVVGPDGTMSEKILYADTSVCDAEGKGTPIFGTQNANITGNITVTLNLILMDNCGREICYPVTSNINVATAQNPLVLTGFFEMCMPSVFNTAFLPRFTELFNLTCETRLATNSCVRDLGLNTNNEVIANLIISLCLACEKKIIVPVELAVLSTGFIELNENSSSLQACNNTPQFYPDSISADANASSNTSGNYSSCCSNVPDPCAPHRPPIADPCAPCAPPHPPVFDPCSPAGDSCRPQPVCCDTFPVIR